MSNRVKKLTNIAKSRFLSLYDAEYENRIGKEKHWIIASRKSEDTLKAKYFNGKVDTIDAVIIVPFHIPSKSLVLIKQFRIPLNDYVYELPAGLLDENEFMEQAVKRELKEETGLSLVNIDYHSTMKKLYISAGMTDESAALVYCTCQGNISNKYLEDDEDIEAMLVSQDTAKKLLQQNINMDIKSAILLQSFAAFGEKLFE